MEDSLITGLRARDLDGEVTYANPAFCAMVGFSRRRTARAGAALLAAEFVEQYRQRQRCASRASRC
jgi:two-component system sensor histidine kinase DctS